MMNKKIIGVMALALVMIVGACPAFAASSASSTQTVQVQVDETIAIAAKWDGGADNSTIDLGALTADGMPNTFNKEMLYTYSNVPIDVYTKASDDFKSGSSTLTLSNFIYNGGTTLTDTAFTKSYVKMYDTWAKAPQAGAPITLKLTVPVGTDPGNYSTIVYFSAVKAGTIKPETP